MSATASGNPHATPPRARVSLAVVSRRRWCDVLLYAFVGALFLAYVGPHVEATAADLARWSFGPQTGSVWAVGLSWLVGLMGIMGLLRLAGERSRAGDSWAVRGRFPPVTASVILAATVAPLLPGGSDVPLHFALLWGLLVQGGVALVAHRLLLVVTRPVGQTAFGGRWQWAWLAGAVVLVVLVALDSWGSPPLSAWRSEFAAYLPPKLNGGALLALLAGACAAVWAAWEPRRDAKPVAPAPEPAAEASPDEPWWLVERPLDDPKMDKFGGKELAENILHLLTKPGKTSASPRTTRNARSSVPSFGFVSSLLSNKEPLQQAPRLGGR